RTRAETIGGSPPGGGRPGCRRDNTVFGRRLPGFSPRSRGGEPPTGERGAGRGGAARAARARGWHDIDRTVPHVLAAEGDAAAARLKVSAVENPLAGATPGEAGVAARIDGPERFAEATLALPLRKGAMLGIDPTTVRLF